MAKKCKQIEDNVGNCPWYCYFTFQNYEIYLLTEKYPSIGGYVYSVGNPIKHIDPDGKAVWLFATKLPGTHVPLATHTFLVVTGDNGKVLRYAAYGPQNGNPIGGDKLTECH